MDHIPELSALRAPAYPYRVFNKHRDAKLLAQIPPNLVQYIGRPTIYGNHFILGKDGDRETVCNLFEAVQLPTMDLTPLHYKHLVCFCHPLRCHGDSIIRKIKADLGYQ